MKPSKSQVDTRHETPSDASACLPRGTCRQTGPWVLSRLKHKVMLIIGTDRGRKTRYALLAAGAVDLSLGQQHR